MIEKKIGKIKSVRFGYGGYDDAMFGVSFTLGSDKESWGTGTFKGSWPFEPDKNANWTVKDQDKIFSDTFRFAIDLCKKAKVRDFSDLKDIPVEVVFEDMTLKSWRILEEVI